MAKKTPHYSEIPTEKWNAAHFQKYLADEHVKHYGIQYASAGGVVAERNLIARYAGTARKSGLYPKDVIKAFIDRCFQTYKPTQQYPGLTFWFMTQYMTQQLQQAEMDALREMEFAKVGEEMEEVAEWL